VLWFCLMSASTYIDNTVVKAHLHANAILWCFVSHDVTLLNRAFTLYLNCTASTWISPQPGRSHVSKIGVSIVSSHLSHSSSPPILNLNAESQISKNSQITWIHQLCSLEANYRSHSRPKLWYCQTPQPEFLRVLDTHSGCATALSWNKTSKS